MTLARELELADADLADYQADSRTPLLDERMYVVTAVAAMKHSELGAIL